MTTTEQLTPLAQLIHTERKNLGLSVRAVAARAEIRPETLRYYLTRWPAKSLPTPDILDAIAKGLNLPLVRVQIAAMASVGYDAPPVLNEQQQVVVNAMGKLTARNQRTIADIVIRLAGEASPEGSLQGDRTTP